MQQCCIWYYYFLNIFNQGLQVSDLIYNSAVLYQHPVPKT